MGSFCHSLCSTLVVTSLACMKRIILVLVAGAAIATVVAIGFQAIEVDDAPRLLIVAGAVVLLVGAIDGLRHPSLADRPDADTDAALGAQPAPDPGHDARPTSSVSPALVDAVIDLRAVPAAIDLCEGATSLVQRTDLVDRLVADGLLRVIDGPISDDEVHTMVMVAVAQGALSDPGALSELGPRIEDLAAALRRNEGLVAAG
jgi:hypothetical protein